MTDTAPRLVGRPAAAAALGIGDRKLRDLMKTGELESVKLGGRRLIPVDAIDDFVERLRANHSDAPGRAPNGKQKPDAPGRAPNGKQKRATTTAATPRRTRHSDA